MTLIAVVDDVNMAMPDVQYNNNNYNNYYDCCVFALGESRPRLTSFGRVLPSARLIRTTLFPERNVPDIRFTLAVMQWAQVVAHDVTLLTEKSGKSTHKLIICYNT